MDSAQISKTRCGMGMCELTHTQIGFLWNAGGRHPVKNKVALFGPARQPRLWSAHMARRPRARSAMALADRERLLTTRPRHPRAEDGGRVWGIFAIRRMVSHWRQSAETGRSCSRMGQAAVFSIMSAAFSPIMIDGALVLPDVSVGMIEASATLRPAMPWTRSRVSRTAIGSAPILQVPTGW